MLLCYGFTKLAKNNLSLYFFAQKVCRGEKRKTFVKIFFLFIFAKINF